MKKKQSKKTNPRNIPYSTEEKMRNDRLRIIKLIYVVFLTVLYDKLGLDTEQIQKVYKEALRLTESIQEGRVNVQDLIKTLEQERNIKL